MKFQEKMTPVDDKLNAKLNKLYLNWGERMVHVPYCNLSKGRAHQTGALKIYPKAKSLVENLASWEGIKWRPLVPYDRTHWQSLLSLLARFCLFAV